MLALTLTMMGFQDSHHSRLHSTTLARYSLGKRPMNTDLLPLTMVKLYMGDRRLATGGLPGAGAHERIHSALGPEDLAPGLRRMVADLRQEAASDQQTEAGTEA
jgi:hypothetical protein